MVGIIVVLEAINNDRFTRSDVSNKFSAYFSAMFVRSHKKIPVFMKIGSYSCNGATTPPEN